MTAEELRTEESGFNQAWEVRLIKWIIYKVAIPLTVMFIIWPIYSFSLNLEHSFEKAFSHADLLIFSALILTEAAIEGEYIQIRNWRFQLGRHIAIALAFISLILFIVVKFDVMRAEGHPNTEKMYMYSCLGWFMALLSGIISIYTFWSMASQEATKELKNLAGENHG